MEIEEEVYVYSGLIAHPGASEGTGRDDGKLFSLLLARKLLPLPPSLARRLSSLLMRAFSTVEEINAVDSPDTETGQGETYTHIHITHNVIPAYQITQRQTSGQRETNSHMKLYISHIHIPVNQTAQRNVIM